MGHTFRYECDQCHFTAEVSGGHDMGFGMVTQTMYCAPCRELVDVVTEYHEAPRDSPLHACPRCGQQPTQAWTAGDPCPRCKGSMQETDLLRLWD